mgnify:CR=1 FL=1
MRTPFLLVLYVMFVCEIGGRNYWKDHSSWELRTRKSYVPTPHCLRWWPTIEQIETIGCFWLCCITLCLSIHSFFLPLLSGWVASHARFSVGLQLVCIEFLWGYYLPNTFSCLFLLMYHFALGLIPPLSIHHLETSQHNKPSKSILKKYYLHFFFFINHTFTIVLII